MSRKRLTKNNYELNYEYRPHRGLLIICGFNNETLTRLADELGTCSQIHTVNGIDRYDSGLSAITATTIKDFNELKADIQIQKAFENSINITL